MTSRQLLTFGLALACALSGCAVRPTQGTPTVASPPAMTTPAPTAPSTTAAAPSSATASASTPSAVSQSPTPTPAPPTTATPAPVDPGCPLCGMVAAPGASDVPSTGGARLAPTGSGPLSGRTIVVDPGHNGRYIASVNTKNVPAGNGTTKDCNTSGTVSSDGTPEYKYTWPTSVKLVGRLRALGATVILTRPNNTGTGPCVNERAAIANRADADLLLSVHADGNYTLSNHGFHVIVSTTMVGGSAVEAASKRVATTLVAQLERLTALRRSHYIGSSTGLAPRSDIAGLNLLASTPGIVLESGNLRSPTDWNYLKTAAGQDAVAAALAATAVEYLRGR